MYNKASMIKQDRINQFTTGLVILKVACVTTKGEQ